MQQYLDFLRAIQLRGVDKSDRTGVGTRSLFGYEMRFDLAEGFPLLTTKKVHLRSVIHELLWFIRGDTNLAYLHAHDVTIWDEWADANGDLGPVYGHQWRSWPTPDGRVIDQLGEVIQRIKTDPDSRRLIVSAWNVGELDKMALPPCHLLFQFYVADGRLSCKLTQRSADAFLGVPFNIASYSLLTAMVAQQTGYLPGEFIWSGGDCHIYQNHWPMVETQLSRAPGPLPRLVLPAEPPASINDYKATDIVIEDYHPQPTIRAPIAV